MTISKATPPTVDSKKLLNSVKLGYNQFVAQRKGYVPVIIKADIRVLIMSYRKK